MDKNEVFERLVNACELAHAQLTIIVKQLAEREGTTPSDYSTIQTIESALAQATELNEKPDLKIRRVRFDPVMGAVSVWVEFDSEMNVMHRLFTYDMDDFTFSEAELIGLTAAQAIELKRNKGEVQA